MTFLLNRLDSEIAHARDAPSPTPTTTLSKRLLARFRPEEKAFPRPPKGAKTVPFLNEERVVEDLRRLAELVIIGENYTSSLQKQKDKNRSKDTWDTARDILEDIQVGQDEEKAEADERLQLFDLFFERDALEVIVRLLTGEVFEKEEDTKADEDMATSDDGGASGDGEQEEEAEDASAKEDEEKEPSVPLLPPLAIATQAIQSISIMIQNVSKATSLYVILSNNYINKLIQFPLHLYAEAADHGAPDLAELTTHFVTFLKSLAMRMNSETLQFFLQYHSEQTGETTASPSHFSQDEDDVSLEGLRVEFPLYERALEFCGAHQDSFVRVTAMNICLNTLRLVTVDEEDESEGSRKDAGSSPDGVLHNAKPLPFRERLAIAQHTCTPSRVERLIAPIFSKLAERWNGLDEQFQLVDKGEHISGSSNERNEKVARVKEKVRKERLVRTFAERSADLLDELMLLEDVFNVGLTVLNEQTVEMMLATFVYPMLLQPLHIFRQRLETAVRSRHMSLVEHPFGRYGGDFSDVRSRLDTVSSSARAALYTTASIFQNVKNTSLLRLLYVALFHPLSPDSTSVPTVRSNLEVATVDPQGNPVMRLDAKLPALANDRGSYPFGTMPGQRRLSRGNLPSLQALEGTEACVFVLAPALAELLEFQGGDVSLFARTRPNAYRSAFLKCLDVPDELFEVRELAICTLDAALCAFPTMFGTDVLFGKHLQTFEEDMPADERNLESTYAHDVDDRDIGGGGVYESRNALGRQQGGSVGSDLVGEVVSPLCFSTINAFKDTQGYLSIQYDPYAAHALLSAVRYNSRAVVMASKILENRMRQAGVFLSEVPETIYSPSGMGFSGDHDSMVVALMQGAPVSDGGSFDEGISNDGESNILDGITNLMVFDTSGADVVQPLLLLMKQTNRTDSGVELMVPVSTELHPVALPKVVGRLLVTDIDDEPIRDLQLLYHARRSTFAYGQMNALGRLMKDLEQTGGLLLQREGVAGYYVQSASVATSTKDSPIRELCRQVYSFVEPDLTDVLFYDRTRESVFDDLVTGSPIRIDGRPAIPCVCEIPATAARLFDHDGQAPVVSEGVTWQSMFITFVEGFAVFVQPTQGDGYDGRVIVACPLERMLTTRDPLPDPSSPARRLILSHDWVDSLPPQLFLFNEAPKKETFGPFAKLTMNRSTLDVWFEDDKMMEHALYILMTETFKAKSSRGRRLRKYFNPSEALPSFG